MNSALRTYTCFFVVVFMCAGALFVAGLPCAWGREDLSVIEKSREYHGYYKWAQQDSVWSVTIRKQKYPGEKDALDVSEIHCYQLKPQLKMFMQTMNRLPLTVRIYDGIDLRVWHNGEPESNPSTQAFARLQSFLDYVFDNFPLIALDPSNPIRILGREQIRNRTCEKTGITLNKNSHPGLPQKWCVVYIDTQTGEIQQMFSEINTPGFQGMFQAVEFKQYTNVDGMKVPQQYTVFPASKTGAIIGPPLFEIAKEEISFKKSVPETLFDYHTHKFLK